MQKITTLIRLTIKHELISGSFYLFVGFFVSAILSFLFNLFLARSLSYVNYGIYASLLSVFTLATIPAASLGGVIVRFAGFFLANNEIDKAASFYKKNLMFWGIIAVFIFLIFIVLMRVISSFLKIKEISLIILVGIAVALSYFGIANSAFLQALTKFKELSYVSALSALAKLLLGIVLVLIGFGVFGATGGILIGTALALGVGVWFLRDLLFHKSTIKVELPIKEILRYGLPASISILLFSSFISSDVILVKHFFSSQQAGYYGGLSLVGKVVFYFTGPVPTVMFPLLIKRHTRGESTKNLLYLSLLLVLLPSVLISIFYFAFPDFTIKLFLAGRDYLTVGKFLGLFGIFLTLYSVNNVFLNFFLSLKKTLVVYFVGIGAALQIILILIHHVNFYQIISSSIISSLLLFIILLIYYMKEYGLHKS